ncbi:MAG: FAD binding domain-containing protein [Pseudomonadota bacterium]
MKAPEFDYQYASSLAHASELLSNAGGQAKLIAGGQSLLQLLNQRLIAPQLLVDIRHIDALKDIKEHEEKIEIGACVTSAALEDGVVAGTAGELLAHVASQIGYRSVRNQGTLGGAVAFADPAGDWPATMMSLNAVINVLGSGGEREISIHEFYRAPFVSVLQDTEIIVSLSIPKLASHTKWSYWKFSPTIGEVTKAIGIAIRDPEISDHRLALGAANGIPCRPTGIEDAWQAHNAAYADRDAMKRTIAALDVADDDYKLQCLTIAAERAIAGTYP